MTRFDTDSTDESVSPSTDEPSAVESSPDAGPDLEAVDPTAKPTGAAGDRSPSNRTASTWLGMSRLRLVVLVGLVAVSGLLAGRWLVAAFSPHLYAGTVLQSDEAAPAMDGLSFADSGERVDLAAEQGDVVLVFFGYTNCPDVCPATMSTVTRALEDLESEQRERIEMWMVSVDPGRDDAGSLQTYVEFFDPRYRGVTGEIDAIDQAASQYGVFYELEPTAAEGADDYLVDHTASLFGVGTDGSLRVIWSPTVTAEQLGADLREML